MKKNISLIIIVTCITVCNSCTVTTLYPIFKETDIIFSSKLLGYWKINNSVHDSDLAEIERVPSSIVNDLPNSLQKISGKGYLITKKDRQYNVITRHLAFLLKIGKYQYIDYYPLETDDEKNFYDFYKVHYIRMHTFYRIDFKPNYGFELRQFDEEFIHRLIDTKQIRIQYESQPYLTPLYIITASTDELQAYINKYADDPRAYSKESSFLYTKLQ